MEKRKTIMAAIVLLLIFFIGGAIAYFTDTKTVTNTFTIGNVEIEVLETNWVAANAQNLMPGQTVSKNPKIHNKSTTNSAYVFMKVVAPCSTGENDTQGNPTPVRELFPYTANSGWYLMTASPACSSGTIERLYAYGTNSAMTELAANGNTPTLFDSVTLNSDVDGSEKGITGNLNMVITGYSVQKEGISAVSPSDVWSAAGFNS